MLNPGPNIQTTANVIPLTTANFSALTNIGLVSGLTANNAGAAAANTALIQAALNAGGNVVISGNPGDVIWINTTLVIGDNTYLTVNYAITVKMLSSTGAGQSLIVTKSFAQYTDTQITSIAANGDGSTYNYIKVVCATAPGFSVGDWVCVNWVTELGYTGVFEVAAIGTTTIPNDTFYYYSDEQPAAATGTLFGSSYSAPTSQWLPLNVSTMVCRKAIINAGFNILGMLDYNRAQNTDPGGLNDMGVVWAYAFNSKINFNAINNCYKFSMLPTMTRECYIDQAISYGSVCTVQNTGYAWNLFINHVGGTSSDNLFALGTYDDVQYVQQYGISAGQIRCTVGSVWGANIATRPLVGIFGAKTHPMDIKIGSVGGSMKNQNMVTLTALGSSQSAASSIAGPWVRNVVIDDINMNIGQGSFAGDYSFLYNAYGVSQQIFNNCEIGITVTGTQQKVVALLGANAGDKVDNIKINLRGEVLNFSNDFIRINNGAIVSNLVVDAKVDLSYNSGVIVRDQGTAPKITFVNPRITNGDAIYTSDNTSVGKTSIFIQAGKIDGGSGGFTEMINNSKANSGDDLTVSFSGADVTVNRLFTNNSANSNIILKSVGSQFSAAVAALNGAGKILVYSYDFSFDVTDTHIPTTAGQYCVSTTAGTNKQGPAMAGGGHWYAQYTGASGVPTLIV